MVMKQRSESTMSLMESGITDANNPAAAVLLVCLPALITPSSLEFEPNLKTWIVPEAQVAASSCGLCDCGPNDRE
jgi:hypothetical protein